MTQRFERRNPGGRLFGDRASIDAGIRVGKHSLVFRYAQPALYEGFVNLEVELQAVRVFAVRERLHVASV